MIPNYFSDLDVVVRGDEEAWAVFSEDEIYRYALGRIWDDLSALLIVGMLNPSKATHLIIDPTIRKIRHYARRDHFGGFIAVNAYAFRATDPKDLNEAFKRGIDVVGQHNDTIIQRCLQRPGLAKAAGGWGRARWPWMKPRFAAMRSIGLRPWHCWSVTKDGNPGHPLYLKNDAPLIGLSEAVREARHE